MQNHPSAAGNVPRKRFETESLAVRQIGVCRIGIYLRTGRAPLGNQPLASSVVHILKEGLSWTAILNKRPTDTLALPSWQSLPPS
jgi:hypothetical protein